ncbi:MAG: GNAT family N-acetyltransferase [Pseudomonadota bacterium]
MTPPKPTTMPVTLRPYRADDAAWLTAEHAAAYARDEGFDDTFGPLVAAILADFEGHDPTSERGWIAEDGAGARLGSIFCVRGPAPGTAKLRLFYLTRAARGQGLGRRLLAACTDFARQAGYGRMTLWTHASHRAACALYARAGFRCESSVPVRAFGVALDEQVWTLDL